MKLDAKTVADLTLPGGEDEIEIADDELPGFKIRLRRSGKRVLKTWLARYRVNGKRGSKTFGDARIVPPTKAREAARKHLAEVSLGYDPQAERAAKRRAAELTFAKVVESYLGNCRPRFRASSFRKATLYLTRPHYFEPLHAMPISEINFSDVASCIRNMESARSAVTANCARNIVYTFFAWTISEGLRGENPTNPVAGTRNPPGSTPRDRTLSNDEIVAFWNETTGDAVVSPTDMRYHELPRPRPVYLENWRSFCAALRLQLLLAARIGEIADMPWNELDLAKGVWTLPKERSKNKRPLTLVLPRAALDILNAQPRRSQFVFGGGGFRGGGLLVSGNLKGALDRRLGDRVGHWTTHDLRRSAATHMAEIGVMPHVIENVLNHAPAKIAGTYNKSRYDREVTAALALWSEHLMALVEGRAPDNVIPWRA